MKLNLYVITGINSFNKGTITIDDSSDRFDSARKLHNFLIENNFVKGHEIQKIEILLHNFIFSTSLPDNAVFHFVER